MEEGCKMGTNFYLMTKSKEVRDKYFGYDYELTDTPDWGYEIHIAKTSGGWRPLFQSHDCFKSIKQLKELYGTGEFVLYDEYGTTYSWEEFDERVLKFNGGVKGAVPREKIVQDRNSRWYDSNLPEHRPISHFEYGYGAYANEYFSDPDGYEFTTHEFC
jgi:hypothetical protein